MKLTKPKALVLAFFTVWPFFYIFLIAGFGIISAFWMSGGKHQNEPPVWVFVLFAVHFLTMFEVIAMIAVYIVHLFKTTAVRQDMKALWAVVLFLGNVLAMPVYWYLYIWRPLAAPERRPDTAGPGATP